MSSLIAPRPPQWRRMHEEEDRQGSLFGGEAFRPPPPRRPVLPREEVAARAPREEAAPDVVARTPREDVAPPAPHDDAIAPREFDTPPEAGEIRVSRGAPTPLAGPTLDDVVTHAWEGLGAGVPAACPVCHGEIEPGLGGALRGHCGSCGVTLD
jgi:hypothetical protein